MLRVIPLDTGYEWNGIPFRDILIELNGTKHLIEVLPEKEYMILFIKVANIFYEGEKCTTTLEDVQLLIMVNELITLILGLFKV